MTFESEITGAFALQCLLQPLYTRTNARKAGRQHKIIFKLHLLQ